MHPQAISVASFTLPNEGAKAFKTRGTYPLPMGSFTWENPWAQPGAAMIRGELMGIHGRTAVIKESDKTDAEVTHYKLIDMRGLAEGNEAEIKAQWKSYGRGNVEFHPPAQDRAQGTARFIPLPFLRGSLQDDFARPPFA